MRRGAQSRGRTVETQRLAGGEWPPEPFVSPDPSPGVPTVRRGVAGLLGAEGPACLRGLWDRNDTAVQLCIQHHTCCRFSDLAPWSCRSSAAVVPCLSPAPGAGISLQTHSLLLAENTWHELRRSFGQHEFKTQSPCTGCGAAPVSSGVLHTGAQEPQIPVQRSAGPWREGSPASCHGGGGRAAFVCRVHAVSCLQDKGWRSCLPALQPACI